jgi:hypothetical protein
LYLPGTRVNLEHKLVAGEFLEELIVRREPALNFVRYAKRVDSLDELPEWALATLNQHRTGRRDPVYTRERSKAPRRAMIYGTPPKRNYCCGERFMAITESTGAGKELNT